MSDIIKIEFAMTNPEETSRDKKSLLMILLTTGVISSFLASMITLKISCNSNRTLEKIEEFRANTNITEFRYKELMKYRGKIMEVKSGFKLKEVSQYFNGDGLLIKDEKYYAEFIPYFANKIDEIYTIYEIMSPLLDEDLKRKLDELSNELNKQVLENSSLIHGKVKVKEEQDRNCIEEIIKNMKKFANDLIINIEKQLKQLQNLRNI